MLLKIALFGFLLIGASCAFPTDDNRVVNGTNAEEGEFPFAVSLRQSNGRHMCGSSIVNEKVILTAAHCVFMARPQNVNVQYGVTEISIDNKNVAKVKDIIIHQDYDPYVSYINDIALLVLEEPLNFTDKIQPVKLPKQFHEVPGGSSATLVGWGYEKSGGSVQNHLQKVSLITFSNDDCNQRHNGAIHNSHICAGVPEGGKGQCSGDSGGPLLVDGEQLGIVSWSVKPCTIAPYPGVYTKVSHHVDWISEQVRKLF